MKLKKWLGAIGFVFVWGVVDAPPVQAAPFDDLISPLENAAHRRLFPYLTEHGRYRQIRRNMENGFHESKDNFQRDAMDRLYAAKITGSCTARRHAFEAQYKLALQSAMLSRDVYHGVGEEMARLGERVRRISPTRYAYQDHGDSFYAEETDNVAQHQVIIAFRGTKRSSVENIGVDIGRFMGAATPHYQWGEDIASQVLAAHKGWDVVATGHSLGGGLALDAAAHFDGIRSIVFNPAGMPPGEWSRLSSDVQQRLIKGSIAYVSVTPTAMDNVSATSVLGFSVIPATIYAFPVASTDNLMQLHSINTLVGALEKPSGNICDYDVGTLGIQKPEKQGN